MTKYKIHIKVKQVHGVCVAGYKPGDEFIIEQFYIKPRQESRICLHALNSMLTLLTPFLKGISAKTLGIGKEDNIGYIQCPDPGEPYTQGGTVIFELRREAIESGKD